MNEWNSLHIDEKNVLGDISLTAQDIFYHNRDCH